MDTAQDTTHDTTHDDIERLLEFCMTPRSRSEMMAFMQLVNRKHFTEHYLQPLLASGRLVMTIPDKPKSKNQKYVKK
jgi:ATP-dependent DNA helicase RecG